MGSPHASDDDDDDDGHDFVDSLGEPASEPGAAAGGLPPEPPEPPEQEPEPEPESKKEKPPGKKFCGGKPEVEPAGNPEESGKVPEKGNGKEAQEDKAKKEEKEKKKENGGGKEEKKKEKEKEEKKKEKKKKCGCFGGPKADAAKPGAYSTADKAGGKKGEKAAAGAAGTSKEAIAAEKEALEAELAGTKAAIEELKPKVEATEAEAEGGEEAAKAAAVEALSGQQAELAALEKTAAEVTAKLAGLGAEAEGKPQTKKHKCFGKPYEKAAEAKQKLADETKLRGHLAKLKTSDLKKWALEETEATEAEVQATDDAKDSKASLIEIIVTSVAAKITAVEEADASAEKALQDEIGALKRPALKKRAMAEGATVKEIDAADDDPKRDVKQLVLELLAAKAAKQKAREAVVAAKEK